MQHTCAQLARLPDTAWLACLTVTVEQDPALAQLNHALLELSIGCPAVQGDVNLMERFRLQAEARSLPPNPAEAFVGGLWTHLQQLLLYTLPSPGSSARCKASSWSGAYRWASHSGRQAFAWSCTLCCCTCCQVWAAQLAAWR